MLGGDPSGKTFTYCRGKFVIVRSIENPIECYTYNEHPCDVTVAKYAPSGNYIASADERGTVRIWDTTQAEHALKYEYRPLGGRIHDLAWTEDSKRIAVCGEGADTFARAFLWDSGSSVGELTGHSKMCNAIDIKQQRPYRLVTASEDTDVGFYAGPPFKRSTMNTEAGKFVNCVRFSPDGAVYVTGDASGKCFVYDGKEGTFKHELNGGAASAHGGGVYGISFGTNPGHVMTCSADKTVKVWDVEANSLLTEFKFANSLNNMQVGCLWQGDHMISVGLDGSIHYLDPANPDSPRMTLTGTAANVTALAVAPGGDSFHVGAADGRVIRVETASGASVLLDNPHTNLVSDLLYAGDTVLSAGFDDSIRAASPDALGAPFACESQPRNMSCSAAGITVVAQMCHVVVLEGADKKHFQLDISYEAQCVSVAPNGSQAAVGGKDGKIRIYDIDGFTLKEVKVLEAKEAVECIAYSPDGSVLAAGMAKRDVRGWDVPSYTLKYARWKFHQSRVACMAWSPDSAHLATGSLDTNIIIWSREQEMKRVTIAAAHPTACVTKVAWGSDNLLFSTGLDGCTRSWDITHV